MELIDYGYVDEELQEFPIPSKPGAKLLGPKDLTGFQSDQLEAIVQNMPENTTNAEFYRTVLRYWIALPGVTWNLSRRETKGDPKSPLVALPLTEETLKHKVRNSDRMTLAREVTDFLYPGLEQAVDTLMAEHPDEALLDGLTLEPGSQAADQASSAGLDPNALAPSLSPVPAGNGNGPSPSVVKSGIAN